MVKLHAGMANELTTEEFEARLTENTRLFAQLAGQLISAVIATCAERPQDDVISCIQGWKRDPLIADLLAAYRRERHRYPTSREWMTIGQSPTQ
jgi:hypothetical protein